MKRFVEGVDRGQSTLFPECLDDWIDEDNPVRVIDERTEIKLVDRREVRLTSLGRTIADSAQEPMAKVDAFLHVPLYRRIFEHHDGYTLPGAGPLERFMREVGVSPKQTGTARQAFMRSARQAGFFAHGEDRLVRPSFPSGPSTRSIEPARDNEKEKSKNGGGDGGYDPPRHPLIE